MALFETVLKTLTGHTRVVLGENERMLVTRMGKFTAILGAGEHWIARRDTQLERHVLNSDLFDSLQDEALFRAAPDLAEPHLQLIETNEAEMAVVARKGAIVHVLSPGARAVFWKDLGPFEVTRHALADVPRIDAGLAQRLERTHFASHVLTVPVAEGHVGVLTVNGIRHGLLEPGHYRFWRSGDVVSAKQIDTRWRGFEVTGHEVLTRDRVTIRVNIAAEMRVVDPELATTRVRDFEETLRLSLALAFRKALGAVTLDALLADREVIGAGPADAVRAEMAGIGIELREIALKDVVLPGEMREILNRVVEAQKEAEANVIRRREETNATRSLLNTAKVMAENPVMMRLKELEALESIAGKVERLTVHNGTEGLMGDLVRLRD